MTIFDLFVEKAEKSGFRCTSTGNEVVCRGERVEVALYKLPFDNELYAVVRVPLVIRVEGDEPPRIAGADYDIAQKLAKLLLGGSITFVQSLYVEPKGDSFGIAIPVRSVDDIESVLAAAKWMGRHVNVYTPAQNAIVVEIDGKPRPLLYLLRSLIEVIASARREKRAA